MAYIVYVLECADGTLYTGCTNNLKRRVYQHNHTASGARYTKTRRPAALRYSETFRTLTKAMKREYELKQWPRTKKLLLIGKDR